MARTPERRVRTLDFAQFCHGEPSSSHGFCRELVDCLRSLGFVKIRNHGISGEEIEKVFVMNKLFFSLPQAAKAKAAHPPEANPHRGYSYVGQEKLSRVKDYEKGKRSIVDVYDIKESYDQGPAVDKLYPNRWPDKQDIPGFRVVMEKFYERCHQVHQDVLRAIATGFDLSPSFLTDLCCENTSELRLNHYPGVHPSSLRKGAKRISEHTDFGTVTLLFQDSVGGLEIEDQNSPGTYFPVSSERKSDMIVNVGDCIQRWTNDKILSTSHRVVLPEDRDALIKDRYSVAYFGKPSRSQLVSPLREFVKEGEKPKYSAISAWQYNQEKLVLTYGGDEEILVPKPSSSVCTGVGQLQ
ncbi:Oxoglutarate/iron-dependent oxygenase [Metarhizium rileyi]|uniref:2-oxoglutarate-Fe(II) type oxidoreductase ppzD n=1 Tax=Metarhizium rileyi (strain RCEF 4871) TaxID=1649241 RepID=PPZD_METRR|nr:RecName: Full=2-oxoglutarate-Fe(II) type oxidoreductase ppzD; AltName: Full=Pyrrolopyrazine biosynthesis cluster protein D [Metarhizium rileyi RCEF 4871]OAA37397.1 Oxoglutarate/iron-dependent oxygenase [Metarhizium rileyi RCEF 4871]